MIPLSLYIHFPWCVKKCPYCDFNSHNMPEKIPENEYIDVLLKDLDNDLPLVWGRKIQTIFMGGGTPSLFTASALDYLLEQIHARFAYSPTIEITLEANPGTLDANRFLDYRKIGINRLSLGVQSFQNDKLSTLGRIHASNEVYQALDAIHAAGFQNFNIDLMYGLPHQTIEDALFDLTQAIECAPTHLSWYQLTVEPNTYFSHHPPKLPSDDHIWEIQIAGQEVLNNTNYQQYEVSAYSQPTFQCLHNRNYWEFGDYLGVGAGAHSKITDLESGTVQRFWKHKNPKLYLSANEFIGGQSRISPHDILFEFMLNALRLYEPISRHLFSERTGIDFSEIKARLDKAQVLGLLHLEKDAIETTAHGKQYLNDLVNCFS